MDKAEIQGRLYNLKELRRVRDTYSDEIPSGILHSDSTRGNGNPKYKCRKAWFMYVSMAMQDGYSDRFFNHEVQNLYKNRLKPVIRGVIGKELVERSDIDVANEVLTSAINHQESVLRPVLLQAMLQSFRARVQQ